MTETVQRPSLELTEFHGMVTVAPQMRQLFELLERVAQTDASVLLRGETGTGKELAAAAIHRMSGRSEGPYRAVNCAVLTPELAASELFGHVKGAFTGAVKDRSGLFALADTGTVFLDEVAELPMDIQGRLLRVLQERTFIPVGGANPHKVDIRLLTATNKSLRREVEEGRFREDLMYRIRVVPIFIPPLTERDGDIEALTWHFIDELNAQGRRSIETIARSAYAMLREYPWPGNIRELHNVLEHAFAVGRGPMLTTDDFPPELRGELPATRSPRETPEDEERARITDALAAARGQKSHAAELLGVSRTTLWRRMRELKLLDH